MKTKTNISAGKDVYFTDPISGKSGWIVLEDDDVTWQ
jgi:hypothetical protein